MGSIVLVIMRLMKNPLSKCMGIMDKPIPLKKNSTLIILLILCSPTPMESSNLDRKLQRL